MPYKSEKIAINNPKLDRRVKLQQEDKQAIVEEYSGGGISKRALARKYNVSRRLIDFIVNPARYERAKEQYAERRKDGRYYTKEKHIPAVNAHRRYKHELYKQGLIKEEDKE